MEKEIIAKIVELVNDGNTVSFTDDWGGNSLTLKINNTHTHCGLPDATLEELIVSLHRILMQDKGLSFKGGQI